MRNQNHVKWTCQIMNEISNTKKFKIDSFHKNVKTIEIEIIKPYEVANKLNKLFTRIDPHLAM